MFDNAVEVASFYNRREAEQHALVLAAVGVDCQMRETGNGIALYVAPENRERALYELDAYRRENTQPRMRRTKSKDLHLPSIEAPLIYCTTLLFFFAAQRNEAFSVDWTAIGAAQRVLIADGEWWRLVTALTLHGDLGHLMGNLVFGVIFGWLVAQLIGSGFAWLSILLAGVLGNAMNIIAQTGAQSSIGASTAVFGAVGVLSGHALVTRAERWRAGLRRWAPVAAGIMLLAFLGFGGERTDYWAHIWGFVAGVGIGLFVARSDSMDPHNRRHQRLAGQACVGLVAVAWLMAVA